jgi:hypothetical protein
MVAAGSEHPSLAKRADDAHSGSSFGSKTTHASPRRADSSKKTNSRRMLTYFQSGRVFGLRPGRSSARRCSSALSIGECSQLRGWLVREVVVDVARRGASDECAGVAVLLTEVQVWRPVGGTRPAQVVALGHVLAGGDVRVREVGVVPLVVGGDQVETLPRRVGSLLDRAPICEPIVPSATAMTVVPTGMLMSRALQLSQVVLRVVCVGMVVGALVGTADDRPVLGEGIPIAVAARKRLTAPRLHLLLVRPWEFRERGRRRVHEEAAQPLPATAW